METKEEALIHLDFLFCKMGVIVVPPCRFGAVIN